MMENIPSTKLTQSLPHPFSPSSFLKPSSLSSARKPFLPMCCDAPHVQRAVSEALEHRATAPAVQIGRRTLFLWSGALLLYKTSAASAAEPLNRYIDEADRFSLYVPSSWSCSGCDTGGRKGPTAARRTLAWYKETDPSAYVTVTVTNVGADYVSLGSFGSPTEFGTNLVGSMDQSFLKRAPKWARRGQVIQEARLLAAKEKDSVYKIEYTVKKGEEEQRHLLSVVAMGNNGRYNRLYTVTAQCLEPDLPQHESTFQEILASFLPPVLF